MLILRKTVTVIGSLRLVLQKTVTVIASLSPVPRRNRRLSVAKGLSGLFCHGADAEAACIEANFPREYDPLVEE